MMRMMIRDLMRSSAALMLALGVLALAGVPSAGAQVERSLEEQQRVEEANKQLLLDFFNFEGSGEERMERFLADDYIQHNPRFLRMDEITGAQGARAWLEARDEARRRGVTLVDLNGIRLRDPIILMAEDDLVTAIYKGVIQDPDDPERSYEAFAFETFRVENGKFTEHWDQVTLEAGWMDR